MLIAICQELGVRAVLTTEVIPWARGAVREIDVARRLMHYAVTHHTLPKHIDDRLVTVKDPQDPRLHRSRAPHAPGIDHRRELSHLHRRDTITVLNSERFVRGTDIQEIFAQLGVDKATHAFYLGKELAKAKLAITLGKTYRQEGALSWGYLTPPDEPHREHMRVTARRHRPRPEPQ